MTIFCILYFQRAACSTRLGEEKKEEEEED